MMRHLTRLIAGLAVFATVAVLAPAAMATTSPSIALDQSAGTTAGGFHDLGLNLSFTNSNADSPDALTLNLPPGLLANTNLDGGKCLTQNLVGNSACALGTGVVHAEVVPVGLITVPIAVPIKITYYLTPPPAAGDLGGIAVYGLGTEIASTGDILIRPSGDSDGVGATIKLVLPNTLPSFMLPAPISTLLNGLVKLSLTAVDSTFDNLRYPATCPSTPEQITGSVDSYKDSTAVPFNAAVPVTDCSGLAYDPQFSLSATRDHSDSSVALQTTITQAAQDAPSKTIGLTFPNSVVLPNLKSIGALCQTLSSSCTQVGSVTAQSPLYPDALTGKAYLTGDTSGLTLTLVFPAPFPLTLTGSVNLVTNTATFAGLPDIPLSSLQVSLDGGAQGLFLSECVKSSGTATAALTDQNGDPAKSVPATLSVSGCPGSSSSSSASGSSAAQSRRSAASANSVTSSTASATVRGTSLKADAIGGLATGHPSLRFTVSVHRHQAKLRRVTVRLPSGLSLRSSHRLLTRGISLSGAQVRSLTVSHGRLVITLRHAAHRVRVTLRSTALRESRALRTRVAHRRATTLRVQIAAQDTQDHTRTLTVTVRPASL